MIHAFGEWDAPATDDAVWLEAAVNELAAAVAATVTR
jgi:hypothetical protein